MEILLQIVWLVIVICRLNHVQMKATISDSSVQHMLRSVFVLFFFVLCTLCCQFLWIFDFWFSLRYSLTFIFICACLNLHVTMKLRTYRHIIGQHKKRRGTQTPPKNWSVGSSCFLYDTCRVTHIYDSNGMCVVER
jgi:hypothetical protein